MKGSLCILKAFQSKHTANTQVYYCYVNDILNFLWPQDASTMVGLRMASIHVFTSGILWALINNSGSSKKCEHHHYVFLHRYLYFDCKEYSQRPVFCTTIKRASFLCCSVERKMPPKCLPMETGESEQWTCYLSKYYIWCDDLVRRGVKMNPSHKRYSKGTYTGFVLRIGLIMWKTWAFSKNT